MTYGELKSRVLELIFSYSVAGSEIPATYNNQQDYINMIPGLGNNAQMDIATTVKRLPERKALREMIYTERGGKFYYELPTDCWMPLTSTYSSLYSRFSSKALSRENRKLTF